MAMTTRSAVSDSAPLAKLVKNSTLKTTRSFRTHATTEDRHDQRDLLNFLTEPHQQRPLAAARRMQA